MDYLDPKKKRKHRIQLFLGYGLFAIAISMATLLLVFIANGYYIDTDTGEVIQNGLVYVDSEPVSAEVFLNGEQQRGSTDARLVIPAGAHSIELRREGYRNWSRSILLEGGSLRRLTYARLIPTNLTTQTGTNLRANPTAVSQSIDRKWLVVSFASNPRELAIVNVDTNNFVVEPFEIPEGIVSLAEGGRVEVVEWADDNRHFLATYSVGEKTEYLVVDRENPALTQNITTELNDANYVFEVSLQNRKRDRFFVYNTERKSLYRATVLDGIETPAIADRVEAYKTFATDWILYITESDKKDMVEARLQRGDKNVLLKDLKQDDAYLLQLAKLGNAPIVGIASPVENRAIIYNDPEKYLAENPEATIPVATTVLRVSDPIDLRISVDSSVIMAYGPKNFASHEFEDDRTYNFTAIAAVDGTEEIRWLDGQHFLFSSGGVQQVMDFNGSNQYDLVASDKAIGSYYSDDLETMFSFSRAVAETDDTPQVPARISTTSLLAN